MKLKRIYLLLILLALNLPLQAQTNLIATIHPEIVLVKNFEGWGTSLCWWANVIGGYKNRSDYMTLIFSNLQLNIVRYNIGGGENPARSNTLEFCARVPGFEPSPGVWDWSADANQRWVLRQAVAMGASRVVAFANSPPWWMTVSGSVTGSTNGKDDNLKINCEEKFSSYLATVVSHLTVRDNVKFDFVTPVNEPTANWWTLGGRQEGCHISAPQQARLVADLARDLHLENLTTGIDAPEDNDEQSSVNSLAHYDFNSTNVALIATHSYRANNPDGIRELAEKWRRPAWISEYGDADGSGLTMARRIRDDIAQAHVSAWIYWQAVDRGRGWGFLYNSLDGSGDTTFRIREKFYIMEQFSRYIRPGAQILAVDESHSLAAFDPAKKTLTIVAVNDSTNQLNVTYDLKKFSRVPVKTDFSRTSRTENSVALGALPVSEKSFSPTLNPESVSTFILKETVF